MVINKKSKNEKKKRRKENITKEKLHSGRNSNDCYKKREGKVRKFLIGNLEKKKFRGFKEIGIHVITVKPYLHSP